MLQQAVESWSVGKELCVDAEAIRQLSTLMTLWQRYGRAMNLSGSGDPRELLRHVLDGLDTAECFLRASGVRGSLWIDVGSGGGFPGLVLAALRLGPLVLLEPRERRAAFLTLAVGAIGAESVVRRARWGSSTWRKDLATDISGRLLGAISARAVFPPREWLSQAEDAAKEGALVVLHTSEGFDATSDWLCEARVAGEFGTVQGFRRAAREV